MSFNLVIINILKQSNTYLLNIDFELSSYSARQCGGCKEN